MNLNQVTIPSHDLATSVAFYETLGLRLIVDSRPRYARFECPNGDSTFSIHHVEHPIQTEGLCVYFGCEDLDQRVAELTDLGIVCEHGPVDQRWLWREARFKDPDGNSLVLFRAGENRRNPPWRVNTESENNEAGSL
ncbi:MAG: hypothetical protein Fues2KO_19900 [Fuerstiella sp.]